MSFDDNKVSKISIGYANLCMSVQDLELIFLMHIMCVWILKKQRKSKIFIQSKSESEVLSESENPEAHQNLSQSESELSRSCQYKVIWVKINSKWLKTVMLKDKIKRYKGQTFKWVTSCLFHQKTTVQSHLQHPMCKVYELQLELDWKERLFSLIRIEFEIYSS